MKIYATSRNQRLKQTMQSLTKKRVFEKFSETGVGAEDTEKRQFGLGYGHKIQSINPIKYFILTKHIVCNRPLQILEVLYV